MNYDQIKKDSNRTDKLKAFEPREGVLSKRHLEVKDEHKVARVDKSIQSAGKSSENALDDYSEGSP